MGDSQVKSRYHHLLSTNDEPSPSERAEIRKIVEQRESAIGQLEAQIIELEEMLNVLKDRHKREKDLLFPFQSALAPIRRVPCDILIEIFLFTRDWTDGSSVIRGLAPITVGITHVCSHWRRVALSVPMLWSTVEATYRTRDGEGTYSFNDSQMQTWLSRSGSLSSLDIICRAPYQASVSPTWMNQYLHRVRTLSLFGGCFELPSETFDALEVLNMSDAYGKSEADISAPALLRFGLQGVIEDLPRIPFHQLTHLRLDLTTYSTHPPMFLAVLSRCSALVELRALCYLGVGPISTYSSIPPPEDHECIVMHNLAAFSMSYPLVPWLLARLALPALKTLRVERTFWSSSIYHSLQSRSSFSLKSIVLTRLRDMNYSDFFDLLRDTPSLREIMSCGTLSPTPTLISGLASDSHHGSSTSILAPNLEYLGICQKSAPDNGFMVHDQVVLDMISSRDPCGQRAVCVESGSPSTKIFKSHSIREPSLAGEVPPLAMKQHVCEDMPGNKTMHHFFF